MNEQIIHRGFYSVLLSTLHFVLVLKFFFVRLQVLRVLPQLVLLRLGSFICGVDFTQLAFVPFFVSYGDVRGTSVSFTRYLLAHRAPIIDRSTCRAHYMIGAHPDKRISAVVLRWVSGHCLRGSGGESWVGRKL
jgi:hypothetical protein